MTSLEELLAEHLLVTALWLWDHRIPDALALYLVSGMPVAPDYARGVFERLSGSRKPKSARALARYQGKAGLRCWAASEVRQAELFPELFPPADATTGGRDREPAEVKAEREAHMRALKVRLAREAGVSVSTLERDALEFDAFLGELIAKK